MTYCIPAISIFDVSFYRLFISFFFFLFFFCGFARSSGSLIKISCKLSVVQVGEIEFSRAIELIHLYTIKLYIHINTPINVYIFNDEIIFRKNEMI